MDQATREFLREARGWAVCLAVLGALAYGGIWLGIGPIAGVILSIFAFAGILWVYWQIWGKNKYKR